MSTPKECQTWYQRNREYKIRKSGEYKKIHPEVSRKAYRKLKYEVLFHYSQGKPQCAYCGEADLEMLSLDHIQDNGESHRKENNIMGGTQTYHWVKRSNYPPIFQVLCLNCNIAKGNKVFMLKVRIHDKIQRLCDLWVSHIEPADHQLANPHYFQLTELTREEKTEFATILKELLDETRQKGFLGGAFLEGLDKQGGKK